MKLLSASVMRVLSSLPICAAITLAQPAAAATLDLNFNYRLTPADGHMGFTVATAHFEDVIASNGKPGVDLKLTNVASNSVPGVGETSYISGLLFSFNFEDDELPSILVEQFTDDSAHSDRWEPQEDVATVDGFTFTSELGFPRSNTGGTAGWRLAPGETGHVQFVNDDELPLPSDLTVASLIEAIRGASAGPNAPDMFAAVKVRSIPNVIGGEDIESVPTIVVGALVPTPVPLPTALPLFISAIAGLRFVSGRNKG